MTLPRRTFRPLAARLRRSRVSRQGRCDPPARHRPRTTTRLGRPSHIGTGRNIPRVVDQSHRCHMGGCGLQPLPLHLHAAPPFTAPPRSSSRRGRQKCNGSVTLLPDCHAGTCVGLVEGAIRQESDVWVFQRLFGGPYVNTPTYINKYFSYNWVPRIDLRAKFKLHTHPKPPPTCAFTQNPCGSLFSPFSPKPSILRNLHSTVTRN